MTPDIYPAVLDPENRIAVQQAVEECDGTPEGLANALRKIMSVASRHRSQTWAAVGDDATDAVSRIAGVLHLAYGEDAVRYERQPGGWVVRIGVRPGPLWAMIADNGCLVLVERRCDACDLLAGGVRPKG